VTDSGFDVVLREVGRRGGGDAELYGVHACVRKYEARDGRLDAIALSDTLSLGLRVFRGPRMGFSFGFRGDDADLARMVEEAVYCLEASDSDEAYGLPVDEGSVPALPLYDPAGERVSEEEKGQFVRTLEADVLSRDPRMKRVRTAALHETVAEVWLQNSRGVACRRGESRCAAHVEAVAESGGEGQTGYGFGFARSLRGLDGAAIAREGAERALRMLGAVRPASGEYRAVLENAAVAELLEVLAPSFLAPQVVKGKSMLAGRVGERPASPAVTIADDPLDPAGAGAEPFDGEGVPARRTELVAAGVLRGYLADAFWGRKIGSGSTGSCRRHGAKQPPGAGVSNLCIAPGDVSPEALYAAAGNGILVTEFLGIHTADPVSGDFSVGASGIRIANGALEEPLRGFAVSGNVLALLAAVETAGDDFRWFGNLGSPSLLAGRVSIGGD
jgi:PmbA protein